MTRKEPYAESLIESAEATRICADRFGAEQIANEAYAGHVPNSDSNLPMGYVPLMYDGLPVVDSNDDAWHTSAGEKPSLQCCS